MRVASTKSTEITGKPLWLHKLRLEIAGRYEAWARSVEMPGSLHTWVRVTPDKKRNKRVINYAIYRNGKRVRGVKFSPK